MFAVQALTTYVQVLSSTNAPGFSLNGNFKSADTPPLELLRGL